MCIIGILKSPAGSLTSYHELFCSSFRHSQVRSFQTEIIAGEIAESVFAYKVSPSLQQSDVGGTPGANPIIFLDILNLDLLGSTTWS